MVNLMITWHGMNEKPTNEKSRYLLITTSTHYKFYELARYSKNLYLHNKYEFDESDGDGFYKNDSEWGDYKVSDVVAWCELPNAEEWLKFIE